MDFASFKYHLPYLLTKKRSLKKAISIILNKAEGSHNVKRVVFIGPPDSGKTTLRKIFFEGENSSHLLDYSRSPTLGRESLIIDLNKKVKVLDLAGKENLRWLESEKESIFHNADLILNVLDITAPYEVMRNYIHKMIEIRSELCSRADLYVIIHKIDLIDDADRKRLNSELQNEIAGKPNIKIFFTSIKKEYFPKTLSHFVQILNQFLSKSTKKGKLNFDLLKNITCVLNQIDNELVMPQRDLYAALDISKKELDSIISHLKKKEHVHLTKLKDTKVISLTDDGKNYFDEIIKRSSIEKFLKTDSENIEENTISKSFPGFIGCFVADKSGKTLLRFELYDGALEYFLKENMIRRKNKEDLDIELIPMFISAIEKFSQEINIKDLNGLKIKGTNLKIQIFSYDEFTITFFINPNVDIKNIESKIHSFFNMIFDKYKKLWNITLNTGSVEVISHLGEHGREFLKELNKYLETVPKHLDQLDVEHAKRYYNRLNKLYDEIDLKVSISLEKLKKLKVNLLKTILNGDLDTFRDIIKKAEEIQSDFSLNIL